MRVEVNYRGTHGRDARRLRKACLKVLKAEKARRDAIVSISVLGEEEMMDLNRRYLSREEPTDVLAFPMEEEAEDGFLMGDVLICPEYIDEHKNDYGVEGGRELEYVAAHGVLHLLGYDDDDDEDASIMDRRQRTILGFCGGEGR